MKFSWALPVLAVVLASPLAQSQTSAPWLSEGDRVEQALRLHRDRLTLFFDNLRAALQLEAPSAAVSSLQRQLENPPPPANVYGYQRLPQIVDIPQPATPVATFTYSWPITEGYVKGENTKLELAQGTMSRLAFADSGEKLGLLADLVAQYKDLVRNQRTVDQYVQYNRFWQRSIAEDRARFDRLTEVYNTLKAGTGSEMESIRKILGTPQTPPFLRVLQNTSSEVKFALRLYTDIEDAGYLEQAKAAIEEAWRVREGSVSYSIDVELQRIRKQDLYRGTGAPADGAHIDLERHVARFPNDGGVLTTGAQFTYGVLGRYVALGPGDLAPRTLAHEFGHILGFPDGYIRGYKDLGAQGFEILELTTIFDDLMSAPREGHVQAAHFKLLLETVKIPAPGH